MGTANHTWVVGDLIYVDRWSMALFYGTNIIERIEKYNEQAIQRNCNKWVNHCVFNTSQNTVVIAYNEVKIRVQRRCLVIMPKLLNMQ